MNVPQLFSKLIEGLNTSELIDLRKWNAKYSRANRHVNEVIDRELNKREAEASKSHMA